MEFTGGKLPWDILSKMIGLLPTRDPDVVVGPGVGEDAGVVRIGDGFLVIHSDPVTTVHSNIGWYAIHVAANDIAVRGVRPRWFLPVIILPSGVRKAFIENLFRDMTNALIEIGGVALGGHTEVNPSISIPLVSVTAAGYTRGRVIMTRDARPGDVLVVSGRIGGEGTSIIARDFGKKILDLGIEKSDVERARGYYGDISVVERALLMRDMCVDSMHDPTEGGLLQAVREMALACGCRATIYREKILLDPVVERITSALKIDPLRLLSSGTIVAAIPEGKMECFRKKAEDSGIDFAIIGQLNKGDPGIVNLVSKRGVEIITTDIVDEIYRVILMLVEKHQ